MVRSVIAMADCKLKNDSKALVVSGKRFAPAKLNLGLRVVGRREDGYHLLEMLNVPIGLCDEIHLSLHDEALESSISVEASDNLALSDDLRAELADCSRNLAARAVSAALRLANANHSFRMKVVKRIPIGAGLGGGSSDAASAMRLTLELLRCVPDKAELIKLATQLGADVPYFLEDEPALVRGIGEIVEPTSLPWLTDCEVALMVPPFGIATQEVYRLLRAEPLPLETESVRAAPSEILLRSVNAGAFFPHLSNDLERFAIRLRPALADVLRDLRALAGAHANSFAGMTGSGSACFLLFPRVLQAKFTAPLASIAANHRATLNFCGPRLQPTQSTDIV